jgi:CO/xanthine dehydrogenase Mo-binding subunit
MPGVVRVLTANDVGGSNRYGLIEADQPVFATDEIRGASDVVALVVATSERVARKAVRHVQLDLECEPPLLDPELACAPDAPVVHPQREPVGNHPNIVAEQEIVRGDFDLALAGAAAVVTGEYRTDRVEHAFMAPEAGLAQCDDQGRLTLHVATQWPQEDLRQAAAALGDPIDRLRIVQQTIGGAFGGREDISLQILLLLATRETGRPVRMVWTREESIRGHGKRHPFRIRHRLAADADGRFVAAEIYLLADAGCYASTSAAVLDNALSQACGPYAIDNVRIAGRAVYTNNPYTCAMRGFGVNQTAFAMEQQANKLAVELGIDADEIRRRNFVRDGGRLGSGSTIVSAAGLPQTLEAARARADSRSLPAAQGDWKYGRGTGSGLKNVGYSFGLDDHASALVTRTSENATVHIGAADVGQGIETVLVQIAADSLGLETDRVRIDWHDTASAPEAGSSSASRQTFVSGNAVRLACEQVSAAIDEIGGLSRIPEDGISRTSTFHAPRTQPIDRSHPARHAYAYTGSTCVAHVRVCTATGRVEVLRVITAIDAGRVLNPMLFEGQAEGGAVMGQGYALQERCVLSNGMPVSLDLKSCAVPTATCAVAEIETIAIESPEPLGPFGARGVGEITMIPVVPAITAAIYDAIGIWIDEIPALPVRVLAAIESQKRPTG